jgi:hypothetical protein
MSARQEPPESSRELGTLEQNGIREIIANNLHAVYVTLLEFIECLAFTEHPFHLPLPKGGIPIKHRNWPGRPGK